MISIALLSKWHVHAKDYAAEAQLNPNIEIKMVWDDQPKRGRTWAQELGVVFESNLDTILADPEIDAVVVTTPTNAHYDVIMAAIQAGKHVFTEKVLAFTRQECLDILQAAGTAGVKLMVSLPRLRDTYYLYTQELVDKGLLGEITSVRCRLAHNGAVSTDQFPGGWLPPYFFDANLCGGGALIDLGAHAIYLTNRLAGQPKAVTARFTAYLDKGVDDNSAVIVEYESGALGILETGFVAGKSPFVLEVHGTEGAVLVEGENVKVRSSKLPEDRWYFVTPSTGDGDAALRDAQRDGLSDYLPTRAPLPMPMEQWVAWILNGTKPTIKPFDVIGLTAINEAAAESNATGTRVLVRPIEDFE